MPRKMVMTYAEMERCFKRVSGREANQTIIGRFAKIIGYRVRKTMVNGRVRFFYVRHKPKQEKLKDGTEDECGCDGAFDESQG